MINRLLRYCKRKIRMIAGSNGVVGHRNVFRIEGICSNVRFDIIGDDNLIEIEKGSKLSGVTIYMRGHHHHLKIASGASIGGGECWFEDDHGLIEIQSKTTIESAHLAVTEPGKKICIGEDCMLATNIQIRTGDSHSIIDIDTGKRLNPPGDVVLHKHVWIGANAVVLKGVTIGTNSIIATNSLVTKDIPENVVAAGQPAKVIKSGVSWLRDRINEY